MAQDLYLDSIDAIIAERVKIFNIANSITDRNSLLPTNYPYPLKENNWIKIKDVISVFVDIRGSTRLSANLHPSSTASIYELFTWTAIRIFHQFWAEYIDIKWDGVFALFSKDKIYTSFAAAITFKTFAKKRFIPLTERKLGEKAKEIDIGFHMGIDQMTVLVKQMWIKNDTERWDIRKNEVWAWKPINMSAKLASLSKDWELYVSERYFNNLWDVELIKKSCWCWDENNNKSNLWSEIDLSQNSNFDFNKWYLLENNWCSIHWKKWCQEIIKLDNK